MRSKAMRQFEFTALLGGLALALSWHVAGAQTISGQLKCHVEGGMSFIVGSSRQVDCVFTPAGGEAQKPYTRRG